MSGREREGSGAEQGDDSMRGSRNPARTADPPASTSEQDLTESVIQVTTSTRVRFTTPGEGMREDVVGEEVGPVLGAEVGGEKALFVIHEEEEVLVEDVDVAAANEGKPMHMQKLDVLGGGAPNDEEEGGDEGGREPRADENADEKDAKVEVVQNEQAQEVESVHEGDQERADENVYEEDDGEGEVENVAMDDGEEGAVGEDVYDEENAEEDEDAAMEDGEEGAEDENFDVEDVVVERVEDVAMDEDDDGAVAAARANPQHGNQLVLAREIAAAMRGVGHAQDVAATDAVVVKQTVKRTKTQMNLNRVSTGRVSLLPGRFTGVQGVGYVQQQMPSPANPSTGGIQTVQNERQDAPEVPAKRQLTNHQKSSMRAARRACSTNSARAVEPNAAELDVRAIQLKKSPKSKTVPPKK